MKINTSPRSRLFVAGLFLLVAASLLRAQSAENLVLNPSFETIRTGQKLEQANNLDIAEHWNAPNAAEPLLFTTIGNTIFDPNGASWPFKARTGKNVAGVNVQGGLPTQPKREYIQGTLKRPLTVGKKYYFSFYVHYHCEGANNIGIVFLPEKLSVDAAGRLNLKPASYQKDVTPFNNTDKTWTLVRDSFIAYMPFQHFIIGNFFTNEETEVESTNYGHYFAYIDDIDVTEAGDPAVKVDKLTTSGQWKENVERTKDRNKLLENTPSAESGNPSAQAVILFGFDSATMPQESGASLDAVMAKLLENPDATVVLTGYASSEGSTRYNKTLSRQRANTVRRFLEKNGIAKARIQVVAGGEKGPNDGADTAENREQNRRVEVQIQ